MALLFAEGGPGARDEAKERLRAAGMTPTRPSLNGTGKIGTDGPYLK